jgi:small nuclear ribonucleoprotein (snRNP)-like protein
MSEMMVDDDEDSLDGYYGTIFQGDSSSDSGSEGEGEGEGGSTMEHTASDHLETSFKNDPGADSEAPFSVVATLLKESEGATATRALAPGGKTYQRQIEKAKRIIRDAEMGILGEMGQIAAGVPVDDKVKQFSRSKAQKLQALRRVPKTLHIVLQALVTQVVQIELKNDSIITGTLDFADEAMNCSLSVATEMRPCNKRGGVLETASATTVPVHAPSVFGAISSNSASRSDTSATASTTTAQRAYVDTPTPTGHMEYTQRLLDTVLVRGSTIRFVLPPKNFRSRENVTKFLQKQQNRGKMPKLW